MSRSDGDDGAGTRRAGTDSKTEVLAWEGEDGKVLLICHAEVEVVSEYCSNLVTVVQQKPNGPVGFGSGCVRGSIGGAWEWDGPKAGEVGLMVACAMVVGRRVVV